MVENKLDRKGQITVFIIVGIIVLLIAVVLFFSLRGGEVAEEVEVVSVRSFVESCLEDTVEDTIGLISLQGGRMLPDDFIAADYGVVSYALKGLDRQLATIEEMEEDISLYVADAILGCTGEFTAFADQGYTIEQGDISASTTIARDNVIIELSYPLEVSRLETTTSLESFRVESATPLWRAHQTMNEIVRMTIEDPDFIDMSALSEFEGSIEILPFSEDEVVYSVAYGDYVFLAGFLFIVNKPPVIVIDDVINLVDGVNFSLQVDVSDPEGDSVVCSDDTAMFDITSDCLISFIPEVPGNYSVNIIAEDSKGNREEKFVDFIVT